MKNKFSCFYDVNDDELKKIWVDPQTIFIFDTNVLLSLYSFQTKSRTDFLKVLFSIKDRIWIPFHVGLEFQKNRLNIIKNRRNTFNELNNDISKLIDTIKFDSDPFTNLQNSFSLKKNYPNVYGKLTNNLEKIKESFDALTKDFQLYITEIQDEVAALDKEKIFVNSHDFIREELDKLFCEDRLGPNIFDTKEKLEVLYQEGNTRYKNKIPPGYEDEKKGEEEFFFDGLGYKSKFGDLIIFKQMINFSREKGVNNIIFISEDIKKDWRHIEKSEGNKTLGARPELKRELNKEAGVENFLIYQIEEFMEKTDEYLDIKIEEDTLRNIKISLEEDKYLKIQQALDQARAQQFEKMRIQQALDQARAQHIGRLKLQQALDQARAQHLKEEKYLEDNADLEEHIRHEKFLEEEVEKYFEEQYEIEEHIRHEKFLEEEAEKYFKEQDEAEEQYLKAQAELDKQVEIYMKSNFKKR